jgi:mRNA interferase MazF
MNTGAPATSPPNTSNQCADTLDWLPTVSARCQAATSLVRRFARASEPGKHRLAIVVSVDDILTGIGDELIVVLPVSSSLSHSVLRPHVARTRLLEPLGTLAADTMHQIERGLALILGIQIA